MVDINKISSILDAQKLKYNDRDLLSHESKLLESSLLKKPGTNDPEVDLLREAAQLLEYVIKARSATAYDAYGKVLLDKLNKAKDSKAYKVINDQGHCQDAIQKLMDLKDGVPIPDAKDNDTIDAEIKIKNKLASKTQKTLVEKKRQQNTLDEEQKIVNRKALDSKKKHQQLEDLLTLFHQNQPVAGRPLANIVLSGFKYTDANGVAQTVTATDPDVNKRCPNWLLEQMVTANDKNAITKQKYWKTGIPANLGRPWNNKSGIEYLNFQTWSAIRDIDKQVFLDKLTYLSSADKAMVTSIYDELETVKLFHHPKRSEYTQNRNLDGNYITTEISDRKDNVWPKSYFDHNKYLKFIRIVFGDLARTQASGLLDLKPSANPNKEWTFKWYGYSDEPFTGANYPSGKLYYINKWLEEINKNSEKDLNIVKFSNFRAVAEFARGVLVNESGTPGQLFTDTEFNSYESNFEQTRRLVLMEIEYIKALRTHGISKDIISDSNLLKITSESRMSSFKRRMLGKIPFFTIGSPYTNVKEKKSIKELMNLTNGESIELDPDKSKIDFSRTNHGDWQYRIDTTHLELLISEEELNTGNLNGKVKEYGKLSRKLMGEIIRLQQELDDINGEIAELEKGRKKPEDKPDEQSDLLKLKKDFMDLYGTGPSATKKYTWTGVIKMEGFIKRIRILENPLVDQQIITAEDELKNKVINPLEIHKNKISSWSFLDGSAIDKMNNINDNEELEKYRLAFEKAGEIIELLKSQTDDQEALRKRIAGEREDENDDIPVLTDLEIKDALKVAIEPESTVYVSWKVLKNKLKSKEQIMKFIDENIRKKEGEFLTHLKAKLPSTDKPADEDSATVAIDKFLAKKDAETVIRMIFSHQLEEDDLKVTTRQDMAKLELKEEDYVKVDGEYTVDAMARFLFEKETGKAYSIKTIKAPEKEENGGTDKVKWWQWGSTTGKILILGGATVLIAGIAAVIFWESIMNWWNGSNGEVEEDNGEKLE